MEPLVCTKWNDLALELLDENEVDIIDATSRIDGVVTSCKKMFDKWLGSDNVSWDMLVQAIRNIKLNYAASEIEKLFKSEAAI